MTTFCANVAVAKSELRAREWRNFIVECVCMKE